MAAGVATALVAAGLFVAIAVAVHGVSALTLWDQRVALVALSRVALGKHYLSDAVAAAAFGVAWLALCGTVLALYRSGDSHAEAANALDEPQARTRRQALP